VTAITGVSFFEHTTGVSVMLLTPSRQKATGIVARRGQCFCFSLNLKE
jgi:hypothetical protein